MKERLTKRNEHGEARHAIPLKGQYIRELDEEAGKRDAAVLRRLCELEDKIEQGTLVELPCKVGDTIYIVGKEIEDFIVSAIEITILSCDCWETNTIQFEDKNGNSKLNYFVYFGWIGKTVFLTREEAEKRLKELQNG